MMRTHLRPAVFLPRMLRVAAVSAVVAVAVGPILPAKAAAPSSLMMSQIGRGRPGDCPSRWCACYLQKVLRETGYAVTNSWRAVDWRHYGAPASPASTGSIMVMSGHIGLVTGRCPDGKVRIVSGNHSHRVGVGCYPMSRAIAWRAPVRGTSVAYSMPDSPAEPAHRLHSRYHSIQLRDHGYAASPQALRRIAWR